MRLKRLGRNIRRPDEIARLRGIPAEEFTPKGLLEAYNETKRGGAPAPETVEAK